MIVELKQVTSPQLNDLLVLWLDSNKQAHSFIPDNYWIKNQALVRSALPQARLFVKEVDGEIVGFLGLVDTYIAGVFVKDSYQRQGIGQGLLEKVKAEVPSLTLSVFEKNQGAFNFYLQTGFRLVKKRFDEETNEVECVLIWEREV